MPKLYPATLAKISELTEENEHELAMWYAAHQLGLEQLEHELATHMCLYLIVGELTEEGQRRSINLRARLHAAMSDTDRAAFRAVT